MVLYKQPGYGAVKLYVAVLMPLLYLTAKLTEVDVANS